MGLPSNRDLDDVALRREARGLVTTTRRETAAKEHLVRDALAMVVHQLHHELGALPGEHLEDAVDPVVLRRDIAVDPAPAR
jgi:hypothetical protein